MVILVTADSFRRAECMVFLSSDIQSSCHLYLKVSARWCTPIPLPLHPDMSLMRETMRGMTQVSPFQSGTKAIGISIVHWRLWGGMRIKLLWLCCIQASDSLPYLALWREGLRSDSGNRAKVHRERRSCYIVGREFSGPVQHKAVYLQNACNKHHTYYF